MRIYLLSHEHHQALYEAIEKANAMAEERKGSLPALLGQIVSQFKDRAHVVRAEAMKNNDGQMYTYLSIGPKSLHPRVDAIFPYLVTKKDNETLLNENVLGGPATEIKIREEMLLCEYITASLLRDVYERLYEHQECAAEEDYLVELKGRYDPDIYDWTDFGEAKTALRGLVREIHDDCGEYADQVLWECGCDDAIRAILDKR